jgi:hypothetical protein
MARRNPAQQPGGTWAAPPPSGRGQPRQTAPPNCGGVLRDGETPFGVGMALKSVVVGCILWSRRGELELAG